MLDNNYSYKSIGIIHSPHKKLDETPIQPVYAKGTQGFLEIFSDYAQGLKDLEGFSHIYLIYVFHKESETKLIVKPFLEDEERGVFATRAPVRPNKIGLSIVKLLKIEGNKIFIENIDVLDGTPLLDIKPYCSKFDIIEGVKSGWQDNIDENTANIKGKRNFNKGKENDPRK
jgi:tRNA-Thr(GGU) m(6)t(6)A37 methyltransferase TsaA